MRSKCPALASSTVTARQVRRTVSLLILHVVLANVVRADGVIRDGLGARVAGRGGTNIAFADAGTILHDNPAGMVNLSTNVHLELGVDLLITNVPYADPDDRGISDHDPIPLGDVAIIRKTADQSLAYGIGFFTPGGFASDYELNGPFPFLGKQKYKSFGSLGRVLPGVAFQVTDRLSVGGTFGVGISHTELEGPYFLQSLPLAGTPTIMDVQATGAAITWSIGLQYVLSERTTLGVNYQSETRFHLNGNTRVFVPGLGTSAFDTTLDMTWPRSLGLGLRHAVAPCHIAAIDVIWYDWSSAFDHAGLNLREPSNPLFVQVVGPQITEQVPLLWRDSVSVRLGMERRLDACHVARCGYAYHRNPIPEATLTPYLPTTVEHTFSLGFGRRHHDWETDVAYQFMFRPTNRVADSGLIGGDFDQSELTAQAHFIYLALTKRF